MAITHQNDIIIFTRCNCLHNTPSNAEFSADVKRQFYTVGSYRYMQQFNIHIWNTSIHLWEIYTMFTWSGLNFIFCHVTFSLIRDETSHGKLLKVWNWIVSVLLFLFPGEAVIYLFLPLYNDVEHTIRRSHKFHVFMINDVRWFFFIFFFHCSTTYIIIIRQRKYYLLSPYSSWESFSLNGFLDRM